VTLKEPAASPIAAVASDYGLLLTTASSREEAQKIARLLIDEKLAACVQLLPIESFYVWQGKTQNEAETLLLAKTRRALFDAATARIKAVHSYSVPEIVAMPFSAGFAGYLQWIDEVTAGP
jgi:periplasmic divalent cation tolerance protein